jgi:hypothetical protein
MARSNQAMIEAKEFSGLSKVVLAGCLDSGQRPDRDSRMRQRAICAGRLIEHCQSQNRYLDNSTQWCNMSRSVPKPARCFPQKTDTDAPAGDRP